MEQDLFSICAGVAFDLMPRRDVEVFECGAPSFAVDSMDCVSYMLILVSDLNH